VCLPSPSLLAAPGVIPTQEKAYQQLEEQLAKEERRQGQELQ
jgi:hypothetical protein